MFDTLQLVPAPDPAQRLAEACRSEAERWVLERTAKRPAPPPHTLPRVAGA